MFNIINTEMFSELIKDFTELAGNKFKSCK